MSVLLIGLRSGLLLPIDILVPILVLRESRNWLAIRRGQYKKDPLKYLLEIRHISVETYQYLWKFPFDPSSQRTG